MACEAEINELAETARSGAFIPEKSKEEEDKETYCDYNKWCTKMKVENCYTEKTMLAYFCYLSKIRKPSSLWSYYSMLKATLKMNHNSDGYKTKKSKVFTKDVETFLYEAPDEIYLMIKVALIYGLAGACRRQELANLEKDDIQEFQTSLLITLRDTKTKTNRMFSIVDDCKTPSLLSFYKKYADLRPPNIEFGRFFLFYKNGKCSRQVVGKNTFGEIPKKIATYLKLPNPELYTGHSFRRTSATLLANAGEGILGVKQIGGWKSTSVAEQYVEDSVSNKLRLCGKIFDEVGPSSAVCNANLPSEMMSECTSNLKISNSAQLTTSKPVPNVNMNNCVNCVVNINF
ncbi:hypothetical protein RI129_004960 [Pyrocoelia pectoralis]|uniref:Tyr recombinase domain-containing protein n=1 Tax=Pyrocoelia pectoralis TaxID=417401 RepID=A0AAN7VJ86_9COLE